MKKHLPLVLAIVVGTTVALVLWEVALKEPIMKALKKGNFESFDNEN